MTPAQFTHADYRRILTAGLEAGYRFIGYEEVASARREPKRFCVLRHDCDNDLVAARDMATIENELGIRATYFLMLRSVMYNLLAPPHLRLARDILELGHVVGLHFDESVYDDASADAATAAADAERELISQELGTAIEVVSFHQPGQRVMENRIRLNCINAYDREDMAEFDYVSDTNMAWRAESPLEIFRNGIQQRIQLLIHPEWWTQDVLSVREKWNRMFEHNFALTQHHLLSRERAYTWHQRLDLTPPADALPSRSHSSDGTIR